MDNIRVMKFGGTSVGDAKRIAAAADLVKEHGSGRPTVVVVSAMSGVTDLLVRSAQAASHGDAMQLGASLSTLRKRHEDAAAELLQPAAREKYAEAAGRILSELETTCRGVLQL